MVDNPHWWIYSFMVVLSGIGGSIFGYYSGQISKLFNKVNKLEQQKMDRTDCYMEHDEMKRERERYVSKLEYDIKHTELEKILAEIKANQKEQMERQVKQFEVITRIESRLEASER